MTRNTLLAVSAALALWTLAGENASARSVILSGTNIPAKESSRDPAPDPTLSQRPADIVSYTVWYFDRGTNHWMVLLTTPFIDVADSKVAMLQDRGYLAFWSPNR
jgi:hypothetical protein